MKILIICALPYDESSTTRAFDTYFNQGNGYELAQIYTNTSIPSLEKCKNFYQITDKRIAKSYFKKIDTGTIYDPNSAIKVESNSNRNNSIVRFLKKDIGFVHLIRNIIWNKKKWHSEKLKRWIIEFNPDLIFYHNSNSIFLTKIALELKKELKIPLVTEIADDYYFSKKNVFSIYRYLYRKKTRTLLAQSNGTIFISEKMQNKYTQLVKNNYCYIHICNPNIIHSTTTNVDRLICYYGNIGLNRYKTILQFGRFLYENKLGTLDVYCPKLGNSQIKKIQGSKGINYIGQLDYNALMNEINRYKFILIAEPLDNHTSRYISLSLSTKVADSLSLSKPIVAIGGKECGTIDFLNKTKSALVMNKQNDFGVFKELLQNKGMQLHLIKNSENTYKREFDFKTNSDKAYSIFKNAIKNFN